MLVRVGEQFPSTHYVHGTLSVAPLAIDDIARIEKTEIDVTSCGDEDQVFIPGPVTVRLVTGQTLHLTACEYSLAIRGGGEFYSLEPYGTCGPMTEEEAEESEAQEYDEDDYS